MERYRLTYYPGDITKSRAIGHTSLYQFCYAHQNPKESVEKAIDLIGTTKDKGLRGELKKGLYYFTPSVIIPKGKRRKYENIESFTGLMQLDFDGEDKPVELKQYLNEEFPYIYCSYLSPSRKGVKALMKIPVVKTVQEYKEYFLGVEQHFVNLGVDSFDHAPYNPILPLYISYDKDININLLPETWTIKGKVPDVDNFENLSMSLPSIPPSFGDETEYKSIAYFARITTDIFCRKVDDIVSDPGHPRWRDACLVLGSRVGAGYLTFSEAESIVKNKLYTHPYLKKGIVGYLKTAYWALGEGIKRPKYYE